MKFLFSPIRPDCATSALVERRMQDWLALQEHAERHRFHRPATRREHAHISVSRQAGAGAEEIARQAGERLGWKVLDKELVDTLAEHYHWPRTVLETLDETSHGSLDGAVATWLDHTHISQERFVHRLVNMMRAEAQRDCHVFVGRGAAFALQGRRGLRVRIVAPLEFRVERFMRRHDASRDAARRTIEQIDRNRREFAQRYFHHDITDHQFYDLSVDVAELGHEGAVDLLVDAARRLL